jgi:hypothetical protein
LKSFRSLDKLRNLMGPEAARALVQSTMSAAGLVDLDDPDQMARFGEELMKKGGILEAVGRAIKIQAIFAGAAAGVEPAKGARR